MSRAQYQYSMQDANLDELAEWAPRMVETLRALPELRHVASNQQIAGLQLAGTIYRDTAARLGLTAALIDQTSHDAYGQRQVSTLFTPTTQYRVVLEVAPKFSGSPDALDRLYIRPPNGDPLPITMLVRFKPASTLLSVNHQSQFPAVTLSFNLAPNVALRRQSRAGRRLGAESQVRTEARRRAATAGGGWPPWNAEMRDIKEARQMPAFDHLISTSLAAGQTRRLD